MKRTLAGASLSLLLLAAACSPAGTTAAPDAAAPAAAPAAASQPAAPIQLTVPAGDYVIDKTHASLAFKLQHLGMADYTARFKTIDATITLDPANISASKVVASVDTASVVTDYPGDYKATHAKSGFASWDEDLAKSTNFFNAGQFPQATFSSTGIAVTGERTARITGDLTLLGVTKPMTLDVTFRGEHAAHPMAGVPALGFSATGVFKRSEFGMAYLTQNNIVGDDVTLVIEAEFLKKPT
jgi:polyisoprenoid-binding protein YceI